MANYSISQIRELLLESLQLFANACKTKFVQKSNIVDNCTSTSTDMPLSANQGKILLDKINEINTGTVEIASLSESKTYLGLN